MPRKKENPISKYFEHDKEANTTTCKSCDKVLEGYNSTNLRKHLQKKGHEELLKEFEALEAKRKQSTSGGLKRLSQPPISSFLTKPKEKVTIEMSVKEVELACLELVTKNGRPFIALEDSGFKRLTKPLFDALGYCVDRKKIAKLLSATAAEERNRVKKEMDGKLVCLKADTATRHKRSFLGLNAQYATEGNLKLVTLAVFETQASHEAEYLKSILEETLAEFGICKEQVMSVTTDNGGNLVRMGRLCTEAEDGEDESDTESISESSPSPTTGTSTDGADEEGSLSHSASAVEIDALHASSSLEDNLDENEEAEEYSRSEEIVEKLSGMSWLKCMRCAEHTLQLAITDFMKSKSSIVAKARELAKILRTPTIRRILRQEDLPIPIIDVVTRWGSTYDMLNSIVSLQDKCNSLIVDGEISLKLPRNFWESVSNLKLVLEPAKTATLQLQSEQLTAGQFHESWVKMKRAIHDIGSAASKALVAEIDQREKILMKNEGFLLSMYFDPRYKTILTQDQIESAREEAILATQRLQELSSKAIPPINIEVIPVDGSDSSDAGEEDFYEKMLAEKDTAQPEASATTSITEELLQWEQTGRVKDRSTNVFKFWWNRPVSPVLKEVAMAALSFPVTQVSVERLFSELKFIMSDQRASLSAKSVRDIMFVRMNKQFS